MLALEKELAVELWPIDKVQPYLKNPRKISDKAISKVATSLKEFGWRQPIVVDPQGTVVVGHTRLQAAKSLGARQVPVHQAQGLSEAQIRAYRLADNRTNEEAKWDIDLLSVELGELDEINLALTGFDEDEFAELFPQALDGLPGLPNRESVEFQQMTFILHNDQVEEIKSALSRSKALGPFDSPNENSNGNALARICEAFHGG